jgi:hypothetical protein
MDLGRRFGNRDFSRFAASAEVVPPVEETVDNLCCNRGERWKTTRM